MSNYSLDSIKAKSRGGHPQSNANGVGTSTLLGALPGRGSFDDEVRIPRARLPWECQSSGVRKQSLVN